MVVRGDSKDEIRGLFQLELTGIFHTLVAGVVENPSSCEPGPSGQHVRRQGNEAGDSGNAALVWSLLEQVLWTIFPSPFEPGLEGATP